MCYTFIFGNEVITGIDSEWIEEMSPMAIKSISYGAQDWIKSDLPTIYKALKEGRTILPVSEVINEIDNLSFEVPDGYDQSSRTAHPDRVNWFKWWSIEAIRDFGDDAKLYVN